MEYRPALRPELTLAATESGATLHDPLAHRTVTLDAAATAVARRLDGTRPLGAILDETAADGHDRHEAERALRDLLLTNQIVGAGDRIRERLGRLRRGDLPLAPLVLEGSRFTCQGSGGCCQSYEFGPLSDDDLRRLDGVDIPRAFPHLEEDGWLEVQEWTAERKVFHLATVGDRCVFLLPDQRCGIHAAFGAEAKPAFCRLYPLQSEATLDGLRISDGGECATFPVSARSGPLLVDQLPSILALLPPPEVRHPVVLLDERTRCDRGHVARLQTALLERAERAIGGPGAPLAAVAALALEFVEAIRACPLAPGEPDATIDRVLSTPVPVPVSVPVSVSVPVPVPLPVGRAAVIEAAMRIEAALAAIASSRRLSAELPRSLCATLAALRTLADPSTPRPAWWAIPVDGASELLRLSLRSDLFGKKLLLDDRLPPALLRIALVQLATLVGARRIAHAEGFLRAGLPHVAHAHRVVQRSLRLSPARAALLASGHLAWDVLAAAPSLLDGESG